jgi:alkaline phosphatase D
MKWTRRRFLKVAGVAVGTSACGTTTTGNGGDVADTNAALADWNASLDSNTGVDARLEMDATDGAFDAALDAQLDARVGDAGRCAPTDAGPTPGARPDLGFASIPLSANFPQGVMAGDALPRRAMVWTRYAGMRSLVLRVVETLRDGTVIDIAFEGPVTTTTALDFVHFDVTGLQTNTFYKYAFIERDAAGANIGRSRVGRFRTALEPGDACTVLTFGGVSCNSGRQAAMMGDAVPALGQAANDNLDFFIHAGDHIYADFTNATTLADYRDVYSRYWRFDGLSDVHASTALYTTWDDHEVYNDWNIENVERNGRQAQLDGARQAFFEFRAFRRNATDPDRIWRGFRWGDVVELFVLDVRGERRPSIDQMISRAQMDWLKRGLSTSTAVFKLVVTSKPITGRVPLADESMRADFWEAFRPQREELLGHIVTNDIPGVVFLSGDIHTGMLSRVEAAGPYRNLREVCMGPACSGDQDGTISCGGTGQNEIVVHRFNYTRFRADPVARTLRVEFIGEGGGVICSQTIRA